MFKAIHNLRVADNHLGIGEEDLYLISSMIELFCAHDPEDNEAVLNSFLQEWQEKDALHLTELALDLVKIDIKSRVKKHFSQG